MTSIVKFDNKQRFFNNFTDSLDGNVEMNKNLISISIVDFYCTNNTDCNQRGTCYAELGNCYCDIEWGKYEDCTYRK